MSKRKPPAKRGRGRPPHEPTAELRKQAEAMTSFGIRQEHIAAIMGMAPDTLRKHYAHEIEIGTSRMVAHVAGNLYRIATGKAQGAVGACCFLLKTRGGWRETARTEVSGPDGAPIQTAQLNYSALSDADLTVLDALLAKAGAPAPE